MKKKYSTTLWAGSDEAFEIFAGAEKSSVEIDAAAYSKYSESDEGILDVQAGIGIIQVSGVLTNHDAWYNEYMGLIAYPTIQEALYRAVADPEVKEILMDMGSPGGSVFGMMETMDAVAKANEVKRVTVFTDSVMASAAMGIGSAAESRYVGKMAIAGSLGVVAKHTEVSKMNADAGITETIIRAGEFKQLANSSEPLTEKARAMIKESVDYGYGVFVQAVADNLGKSYQLVDSQMAQGREFTGQQAVEVGLVDAVSTFDEVFASMQDRISKNSNGGGSMKKRYAMSEAMKLAAAASGGVVPLDEETPEALAKAATLIADEAEKALKDDATDEEKGAAQALRDEADELTAKLEVPEGEGAPPAKEDDPTDVAPAEGSQAKSEPTAMDLLQSQSKDKDDEIFALKTKVASLEADNASLDALKEICAKATNNMLVALGGTEADLKDMSASDLVLRHSAEANRFATEFKIGGVAATGADEGDLEPVKKKATISRLDQARSRANAKK